MIFQVEKIFMRRLVTWAWGTSRLLHAKPLIDLPKDWGIIVATHLSAPCRCPQSAERPQLLRTGIATQSLSFSLSLSRSLSHCLHSHRHAIYRASDKAFLGNFKCGSCCHSPGQIYGGICQGECAKCLLYRPRPLTPLSKLRDTQQIEVNRSRRTNKKRIGIRIRIGIGIGTALRFIDRCFRQSVRGGGVGILSKHIVIDWSAARIDYCLAVT